MIDRRAFGRFAETARLVLVALRDGPSQTIRLFEAVRALNGPVGPGTLYAAIARLERGGLIEGRVGPDGRRSYRLTDVAVPSLVPGGAGS